MVIYKIIYVYQLNKSHHSFKKVIWLKVSGQLFQVQNNELKENSTKHVWR